MVGRDGSNLFYPSSRVRRSSRGLIHCIASCRDCEWSEDNFVTAGRRATAHVRATGHTVSVEQGIQYTVRSEATADFGPAPERTI